MKIFKVIVIIISLIIPKFLLSESYDIKSIVGKALENNTTLKQSELNLKISQSQLVSSKINYFPDISAGFSKTESFDTILFEGNQSNNAVNFSVSKSFSLNDDAYFGNQLAKNSLNTANLNYDKQKQKLIFEVINNYIDVLDAQTKKALYNENIKIQENIVRQSKQLFAQNKITAFDVQQSEINLLNAKISALNAENNLDLKRKQLFDLINITDEGHTLEGIDKDFFDLDFQLKKDNIIDIKLQNIDIERIRINITQTKLDFYPQINLYYNYRRTLQDDDFSFSNKNTDHTIGLNLSYSLNKLFKNNQSYKQVQYLNTHKQLAYSQLETDIETKFEQYLKELNYYQQLDLLLSSKLSQTNANLDIANQRYSLGLISQLDLDKITYENLDAKINYEVNQYQIILKRLSLIYLLSDIDKLNEKINMK